MALPFPLCSPLCADLCAGFIVEVNLRRKVISNLGKNHIAERNAISPFKSTEEVLGMPVYPHYSLR